MRRRGAPSKLPGVQGSKSLDRLAAEVEGWLELGCPGHALDRMAALLEAPSARPVALTLKIRALVELKRHAEALDCLDELAYFEHDVEWRLVTEAWCRRRVDDLPTAIKCMRRLIEVDPRSSIAHFNLGCYLALIGAREEALEEVTVACGMDERFREHARTEPDLDSLRDDPRFSELYVS